MRTEEKLHLLIQRVSDIQAKQEALEYFSGFVFSKLLTFIPNEDALKILNAARRFNITAIAVSEENDHGDAEIMKLKVEEAVHSLIDDAERKIRSQP